MLANNIISDWKRRVFKPVYWLEGEEEYFIDKVMDYAESQILNESETGFNLMVFYGKDADWASVMNACRRYPMPSTNNTSISFSLSVRPVSSFREGEEFFLNIFNTLLATLGVIGAPPS